MFARSKRTTTIMLVASLLTCCLLLGMTARYLHLNSERAAKNQARALHTVQMITTVRSTLLAITDAETGQRGFLLTDDPAYLRPYVQSTAALPGLLTRLGDLTVADPNQRQQAVALQAAVAKKTSELQQSLDIFRASGLAAAQSFVKTNAGHDYMAEIRDLSTAIIGNENTVFSDHVKQAARDQSREEAITLAIVGGAVAILMAAALILFFATRRSDRAQNVLQATINGVTRGLVAFENGGLVAWNDRFFDLLRLPRDLAKKGTSMSRFEAVDTAGLLSDLGEQFGRAQETRQSFVVERKRSDGAIFRLYFSPPDQGVAVLGVIDATVTHQSELFLQNAQKMDALGHLTGGIAHDFNNLLTVVLMNLEAMSVSPVVMEKFGRRMELMTAASKKGAMLVRQLLAYARKQPLEPEVIDLRDVMPGLIELIKRTIGEDIDVSLTVDDDIWPTIVDPAKFESAALNLAINARDAMPEGGSLVLELTNATLDKAYADRHPEVTAGDYVLVVVSDTGTGMPPEVIVRAFDPFFTTKGEGRGTGLGLSMVYGFVKQTGGHIKIYSEPGQGTTIKLYFPRCREEVFAPPPSSATSTPRGSETVLIVEDDEKVRATTVSALQDLGYQTLQASDGPSALELLRERKTIDLLLTDIVLSGSVNGHKLAEAARKLRPDLKILFTSGYTEKAINRHTEIGPVVGLLNKPYRMEELATTLRDVLERDIEIGAK